MGGTVGQQHGDVAHGERGRDAEAAALEKPGQQSVARNDRASSASSYPTNCAVASAAAVFVPSASTACGLTAVLVEGKQ